MKVITLHQTKGGCGKTTLATHLAAGLAIHGHRVLLVDADPQGSATKAFGLEPWGGLYRYLVQDDDAAEVITPVTPETYTPEGIPHQGYLGLIRGNVETRNIANTIQSFILFHDRMQELDGIFDFVVVDTSPTPSLLHTTLIMGTDYLIMPTLLETMSIDGLLDSVNHLQKFHEQRVSLLGLPVNFAGIVPTMTLMHTVEHSENYKDLNQQYGQQQVWQPIPRRIVWAESATFRTMVWNVDNLGKAAAEAWDFVQHFEEVANVQA
jgi:chromosome partitioning protein